MDIREAEAFVYKEARLLDKYDLREWLTLFTEDALYWVPLNEETYDPTKHVSICYDNMTRLETRIWRVLDSGLNHTQDPPSRFVRIITNVEIENGSDTEATIYGNMLLTEYKSGYYQRITDPRYYPAHCEWKLRKDGDDWKIAFKKINLLQMDGILNAMTFII